VPARPRKPAIPGIAAKRAVGRRLHVCRDLGRLCLRCLCHRHLRPAHPTGRGLPARGQAPAGVSRERHRRVSCSTLSSRLCMTGARCIGEGWFIIVIEAANTSRSNTPGQIHRAPGRSRHRAVRRQCRRQLRQRVGRDHQRPLQGRGDPPARALAVVRSRRVRQPRMGRLVQPSPAAGAHRQHSPGRSGRPLLRYARPSTHGSVTQTKQPPGNPGRFSLLQGVLRRARFEGAVRVIGIRAEFGRVGRHGCLHEFLG